jgi:hypothetical protein
MHAAATSCLTPGGPPHPHAPLPHATTSGSQARAPQPAAIPPEAIRDGLASAELPGRFQVRRLQHDANGGGSVAAAAAAAPASAAERGAKYVVLDGAHTAESAAALVESLRSTFPVGAQRDCSIRLHPQCHGCCPEHALLLRGNHGIALTDKLVGRSSVLVTPYADAIHRGVDTCRSWCARACKQPHVAAFAHGQPPA